MRAALVSLVALTLAACAASETATPSSSADFVTANMADGATVLADRLVFPHALVSSSLRAKIDAGTKPIVMGGRSSSAVGADGQINPKAANPNGFARHALSYTDDGATTTIMTAPASMEEAFEALNGTAQPAGISPQFEHTTTISVPVIDLSNKELWSNGTASLKLKTGSVTLNTGVDVGTDIDWYKLGQAHVILTPELDAEMVLEAEYDGPVNLSVSHDVYTGSWPVGSIGPVPVTLGLTATVACDLHADGAASITAGVKASASMKGGVSYDKNSGKSPVNAPPTLSASIIAPQFSLTGSSTTTCHIRPQFSVLLFDAAGPTLTPDLAARLDASNATGPLAASVTGELGLDVGGKLDLFGKDLGAVNYHLFTLDKQLWSTAN